MKLVSWKLFQLSEYLQEFVLAQREHTINSIKVNPFYKINVSKTRNCGASYLAIYNIPGPVELNYTR